MNRTFSSKERRLGTRQSRVGVYKCLLLIVGFAVTVTIWPREVVSCRDFILRAVATFWAMSLVGIYPGRTSLKLLSQCYYLWFKAGGFRLSSIFFLVFDVRVGFPCYCLWFKAVGFRFSSIFCLVLDLKLVFPCYCL